MTNVNPPPVCSSDVRQKERTLPVAVDIHSNLSLDGILDCGPLFNSVSQCRDRELALYLHVFRAEIKPLWKIRQKGNNPGRGGRGGKLQLQPSATALTYWMSPASLSFFITQKNGIISRWLMKV